VLLRPDGLTLATTLVDARAVLTGAEDFVLPFDVSRRRVRRGQAPPKATKPLSAESVRCGRQTLVDELVKAEPGLSAPETDTMRLLRVPMARSTTASLLPEVDPEDRARVAGLVLAWIDSLAPIIAARRPPSRWSVVRRTEQRAGRVLVARLRTLGCSWPEGMATALAAGIQVPIAAGAWCLTQLACRPELQPRLREEPELASAFVWETLRLFPPSWLLPRITTRELELGHTTLPAYTPVIVSPLALGRLPEVAPGPEAGFAPLDELDPDRWSADGVRPGAWLPFGAGANACPGRGLGLALLEELVGWAVGFDLSSPAPPGMDASRGLSPAPARITFGTRPPARVLASDIASPFIPGVRIVGGVIESPGRAAPDATWEASEITPASVEACDLADSILTGEGSITEAVERAGQLLSSYPGVDVLTVSLTQIVPDDKAGWVHLGDRAWLREWSRPGTTASSAPREDADADQALSMPWVSPRARRGIVVVPDSELLPPEAQEDRRELATCGLRALVTTAMVADGVMFGSLAMTRATPGPWPPTHVADVRLLRAALAARMSAGRAQGSLADAIQRGDLARASQQEFFAAIGHELRTPLAAIVGTAELLGGDARDLVETLTATETAADDVPPEDAARFATSVARDADVVLSAGEQLLAIVEDLLGTAQALGGGAQSQWVDVADAVADVVHWFRAPALSAQVTVAAEIPPEILALTTPSGLRQILTNMVANAIAYNTPGGSVQVTQAQSRNEFGEPRVRVSVRDTGPGLTPEQRRDVFKPFVRFAGPEIRGTGLGLSLSRSLAERDGGMMGVESTPGDGSVFWVDLPAAAPDAP
jgi:signal transduction histidine kinase